MKILKFYTTWCNPCKVQTLLLNQVDLSGVELKEIDAEVDPITASKFDVRSVPTLIFLKDGEVVERFTGLTPPETITETISRFS
jgi:thioredoxin 1